MFRIKDFECISSSQLQSLLDTSHSKVWLIKPYDKFTCYNEDDVYELEKKLNDMKCTTKVARNIENGVLSVVVLSVPGDHCLVVPEVKLTM